MKIDDGDIDRGCCRIEEGKREGEKGQSEKKKKRAKEGKEKQKERSVKGEGKKQRNSKAKIKCAILLL